MRTLSEPRRTIRLKTENGIAILHYDGLAPLSCPLTDISIGGCALYLSRDPSNETTFDRWAQLLIPGRGLVCELHQLPEIPQIETSAVLCHAEAHSAGRIEIGLAFVDVSSEFDQVIHSTVAAMAVRKLAHGQSLEVAQQPTGAPTVTQDAHDRQRLAGRPLSEVLIAKGILSDEQFEAVSDAASVRHLSIHRYLLQQKLVTPQALCRAEALAAQLPITSLTSAPISQALVRRFRYLEMMRYECVPFAETEEALSIAAVAPLSPEAVTQLTKECGKEVLVFLAPAGQVLQQLARLRPRPAYDERKNSRQLAVYPVHCHFCDTQGLPYPDGELDGMTVNLSTTGLHVVLPAPEDLPCGELLERAPIAELMVQTPSGDFHGTCQLRHVELHDEMAYPDMPLHLGVKLTSVTPLNAERLKSICMTLAVERMKDRQRGY